MTAVTDPAPAREARRCHAGRPDPEQRGQVRAQRRRAARAGGLALVVWAVVRELRLPPEQRSWHGRLAGLVPYDLRRPTLARLRQRMWAPDGRLVTPQVFGVGWTLNVGRLLALARRHPATCASKAGGPAGLTAVPDADAVSTH
jgi:hypothetical protein